MLTNRTAGRQVTMPQQQRIVCNLEETPKRIHMFIPIYPQRDKVQNVFLKNVLYLVLTSFLFVLPIIAPAQSSNKPQTYQVAADSFYHTFFHRHPVLKRIHPGDIVQTKTLDAAGYDENSKNRAAGGNPLTGSFYVEGAEPGDVLIVHLRKLTMNRNWGFTAYRLGLFSLLPSSIEELYPNRYKDSLVFPIPGRTLIPWDIDLNTKTAKLREPVSKKIRLEFPTKPMLGCIGVAAKGEIAPSSGISGPYGGNLDYNEICEGAVVLLPVYHPGALLFIGDAHALQGDGEPTGNGIETSLDVEFQVEIKKKGNLTGPRVENKDYIISIGSQPEFVSSLDRGLQMATSDMANWLVQDYGLEPWAAHLLIGYTARYDVVTVAGSMAIKILKKYLPAKGN